MGRAIEVTWKIGQFAGYADVFPVEEFATDVKGQEGLHLVRGPREGRYSARYRLHVHDLTATFDYRVFAEFNRRHGIELGRMEFRFTGASRTTVKHLFWDRRPVPSTEASVVTTWTKAPVSTADVVTSQQQSLARQRLRPGQAKFRFALDHVYGARCCASGCTVPWAVDAAHISPYATKESNSVNNGILLRGDLHSLFDSNQLAVHPTSGMLYFSPEALEWSEYRALHGRRKLLRPQPGREKDAPDTSAFRSRWKAFVHMHGHP